MMMMMIRDGFLPFPGAFERSQTQQPCPGFELGSLILFPTTIIVMISATFRNKTKSG